MEKEIFKDIEGYEGFYQVSSYGRVRSLDRIVYDHFNRGECNCRKRLFKGRILKPAKDKDGYLLCNLWKNRQMKTVKIHRLVAEAFIPNPNNLPEVNHKDENKVNNRVFLKKDGTVDLDKSNLEWCSHLYNMRFGTCQQRRAEKHSKSVLQLDTNTGQVISEYPSLMEAARKLNIDQGNISKCCKGRYKTAYGYKWKYK